MVASDRISVYDVILPTPVPDKGAILTQLSLWWFSQLVDLVDNHVISEDVPGPWRGRAIRVRPVTMVDVECIARGYLAGLGWDSYRASGAISGSSLPAGLPVAARLDTPIFTPSTKAPDGQHDEHISRDQMARLHGENLTARLESLTLALYRRAADLARDRGIIIADTKLEFGITTDGDLIVADEIFTPDSSRFWRLADWSPGTVPMSYDKQFVRDWSATLADWDRTYPGPEVPDEVVAETRARYVWIYETITGQRWEPREGA